MGLSLRNLGRKIEDVAGAAFHGINPLDNGQGWTNQAPQNIPQRSVIQQIGQHVNPANIPQARQLGNVADFTGKLMGGVSTRIPEVSSSSPLRFLNNAVIRPVKTAESNFGQVLQGNNPYKGTLGQQAGQAGQDIITAASFVPVGKAAQFATKGGSLVPRIVQGAKTGSKVGAGFGAAQGVSTSLQNQENIPQTLKTTAVNTLVGGTGGAVLGGATPIIGASARGTVKLAKNAAPEVKPVYADYQPNTKAKVSIKQQTTVTPAKNGLLQELKTGLSDKDQVILDELRNIEKQTGQKGLVDKFMYNSNMQRGSNAGANVALQTSQNIQKAIGGLSKKDYQNFSDYANARTELSTAGKGSTSRPVEELQARVASASPDYQARFDALNAHYKDLADKALESGLISPETHANYVANNDYIRIQRDMGDLLPPQSQGRGNSYSIGQTVLSQKRKGSSRAILPAGETAADYTQRIYREAAKNKTGTQLVDTLNQYGLAKKLKGASDATHKNSVTIIRNGKNEYYEVSPQMKEAIQNINPYHMNAVMQILAAPGRILRAGVTGLNPVFIARNLVKDQAGSAINSTALRATHNPASFFSGLYNATKGVIHENNDPLWNDFLKHYGDQTSYDLTRNVKDTQAVINRIRGGKKIGAVQAVKSPIRSLENLASITEKSTRFQNYRGAYKRAISEGLSKEQASEKAAIAAWQNSVDFSRAGTWGRTINAVIPYWNPATQGVRQMGRTFTRHPIKSTFTGTALVGLPIATATAWNLSSPDIASVYANIPEYEKDNNLILIPPGTKQNADGSYDVIKIPLPPGYKDAFMPIRRALEAYHNDKPVEGGKIAQDILQTVGGPVNTQSVGGFAGSFVPQAVKPLIQQYANKDLFTGKQIVPDYVQQAKDAQGNPVAENKKAFKYTSGTARNIANLTGTSPIRVEKFIKDVGGTVGLNILNAVDTARANAGQIPKEQVGGQSVQTGIKRSFGSAQGIENTNKSAGAKYFDQVKKVTEKLNGNELAAYNSLHPAKNNFLGEQITEMDSTYNPAARLDVYNRYPKVFEADKALDAASRKEGKPGNPLFDQETWQVKKILEKDNLPPGAKDPELSNLYNQPWYQDYQTKKSAYFSALASDAQKAGKPFSSSDNPYPNTPPNLQKVMDYYSSLPKNTGARSSWIKSNPGQWNAMQEQFAKIDNWQNIQRGKRGLDTTEGAAGIAAGYGTAQNSTYGKKSNPVANSNKYKVALNAGGSPSKTKLSTKKVSLKGTRAYSGGATKNKVSIKKSKV